MAKRVIADLVSVGKSPFPILRAFLDPKRQYLKRGLNAISTQYRQSDVDLAFVPVIETHTQCRSVVPRPFKHLGNCFFDAQKAEYNNWLNCKSYIGQIILCCE